MIVQTIKVGHRVYEQRFNRCGKPTCLKCKSGWIYEGLRFGHGPYWYLCVTYNRRWRRVYIGKILNTELFIDPAGEVDWGAIKAAKRCRLERLRAAKERLVKDG